jgi:hypothetical protein
LNAARQLGALSTRRCAANSATAHGQALARELLWLLLLLGVVQGCACHNHPASRMHTAQQQQQQQQQALTCRLLAG